MWPFKNKKIETEPPKAAKSEPPMFPGDWQRVYVCSACGGVVEKLGEVVCPHCGEDNSPFSPSVGRSWKTYYSLCSVHSWVHHWELKKPKNSDE